eukprot:COSAG01_NODE_58460_length_306_cov_0.516908_1_plen_45_part_10
MHSASGREYADAPAASAASITMEEGADEEDGGGPRPRARLRCTIA